MKKHDINIKQQTFLNSQAHSPQTHYQIRKNGLNDQIKTIA